MAILMQVSVMVGWGQEPATNQQTVIDLGNGVTMAFVWIEPGTFVMGSPRNEIGRHNDEHEHTVRLTKGFWMGKHEVTQEQWRQLMTNNPSYFSKSGDKAPVDQMSWIHCQEFLRRLNALPGNEIGAFRLPTEAEWEYACRAGTTTAYHYGEVLNPTDANCWEYRFAAEKGRPRKPQTIEVGSFKPNAWGLYDMHGSLWEWCADWYGRYPTQTVVNPKGPERGKLRVVRGGSWRWPALGCRSATRNKRKPGYAHNHHGVRVAASPLLQGATGEE
jgi:formylglycine-generating enzyme required for sulfatase activity